jgi:hypothetical protein
VLGADYSRGCCRSASPLEAGMPRRFPKTRADGTFRVRMSFDGFPEQDTLSIQRWLAAWVDANQEWNVFSKTHRYSDYFRAVPRAVSDSRGFGVILEGVSTENNFWKDWYVQLTGEMLRQFPELEKLKRVVDEP